MEQAEILRKLTGIARETFDNDNILLQLSTTAQDVEEWDSTAHVRLMVAIEEEFAIQFDVDELSDVADVGELVKKIVEKLPS